MRPRAIMRLILSMDNLPVSVFFRGVSWLMFVDKVQLLKHGDLIRYLQAIIPALDDVSFDATRLAAVHSSALSMNHGRGRKESGSAFPKSVDGSG